MPAKKTNLVQINFRVYAREIELVERFSKELGMTKNALVRHAVELLYARTKPLMEAEKEKERKDG